MKCSRILAFQVLLLLAVLALAPDGLCAQVIHIDSLLENFISVTNRINGCPDGSSAVGATIELNHRIPAGPFPTGDTSKYVYPSLVSFPSGNPDSAEHWSACSLGLLFVFEQQTDALLMVCSQDSGEAPVSAVHAALRLTREVLDTSIIRLSSLRHIDERDSESLVDLQTLLDSSLTFKPGGAARIVAFPVKGLLKNLLFITRSIGVR